MARLDWLKHRLHLKRPEISLKSVPLFTVFVMGLIIGIFTMNVGKSVLLDQSNLFETNVLYRMKYMSLDKDIFFWYVLRQRFGLFLKMMVLSTTYLGLFTCIWESFHLGFVTGIYWAALALRYGFKGMMLSFTMIFPQFIIYIPGFILLIQWCKEVYEIIYEQRDNGLQINKKSIISCFLKLVITGILLYIGCLMETYLNPGLVTNYLKQF